VGKRSPETEKKNAETTQEVIETGGDATATGGVEWWRRKVPYTCT
jgi:hypothetical protein